MEQIIRTRGRMEPDLRSGQKQLLSRLPKPLADGYFDFIVTFAFFFIFGARALVIHSEKSEYLLEKHPLIFFETRETGYFNLGAAYFLAGFNAVGSLVEARGLESSVLFGYYSLVFDVMAVYFGLRLIRSLRQRLVRSLKQHSLHHKP